MSAPRYSPDSISLCPLCGKPPGTKVGPPAMARCVTEGCEGKNLAAVTLAEWNAPAPAMIESRSPTADKLVAVLQTLSPTEEHDIDFLLERLGLSSRGAARDIVKQFRRQIILVSADEALRGAAQTPALDAILEALKPFAALGMPRGGAVDTARVDIWERANHGDTRVLLTSPSQQGGSVTLSTADFRAAHDALAATQQSPRLAEQLYRQVITKDRIYYEPAERQQSPRLEREGWQPIETAPRLQEILLWWRHGGLGVGGWDDEGDGWRCEGDACVPKNQSDCTHWMPKPAGPSVVSSTDRGGK